jgi:putative heme-binding domain-containing protein
MSNSRITIFTALVVSAICFCGSARSVDAAPKKPTITGKIKLLDGFKSEMVYAVPKGTHGSWVALTVDPKGRLIASDQGGRGLYRITPAPLGQGADKTVVEKIDIKLSSAQGLLCAFGSLYVVVNGRGSGLYRVRDTNGDDKYDEVKKLRAIAGGGEHGPHGVILSPDGKSLYVCGGNHTNIPNPEKSLVPRTWKEDLLLPRQWDARGHARGKLAPGGWICRTDPDGKSWELVCNGFRNEYDIAFSPEGELFTYDADMEWDIGTPWYRPTRVNHATSGAEFGWRSGTGKWPSYFADSLPAVVNVGPGSPTGITFGTGAKFPAKYQRALFINDWSFGKLYAVHLKPQGSSYVGELETFATAAPLALTDVTVNPKDGALYFAVGGRGTQSGLFRITYAGKESTAAAAPVKAGAEERALRHKLEALHGKASDGAIATAWPHLSHADRHIRFAARIAVEHQPVAKWQDKALSEKNSTAQIHAIIALARHGDKALGKKMIAALGAIDYGALDATQRLALLRAYALTFIRMGKPDEADRSAVLARLTPLFPAETDFENREFARLLVYLGEPTATGKTLALLKTSPAQESQIQYAFVLRNATSGWTIDQRKAYFGWFRQASKNHGGASFGGFLRNIKRDAVGKLSAEEKKSLADVLAGKASAAAAPAKPRPLVKKWAVAELASAADKKTKGHNYALGRALFGEAACFKCHRFAGDGGIAGPDLTAVGRRFGTKDLLESILEPSKVISDQYQATQFVVNGKVIEGRIANMGGDGLSIVTDMFRPGAFTNVRRSQIEEMRPSPTSMMPKGLLDNYTKDEIIQLLAYLRSGGDAKHEVYAK